MAHSVEKPTPPQDEEVEVEANRGRSRRGRRNLPTSSGTRPRRHVPCCLQSGTAGRAGAFRGACIARAAYDGVDRRGRAAGTATGLTDGSGRAEGVLSWRVKVEMWLENAATCQRDTCVVRRRASVSYSIFSFDLCMCILLCTYSI